MMNAFGVWFMQIPHNDAGIWNIQILFIKNNNNLKKKYI